ncbi:MAG: hypothetical protein KC516_00940 [Nanoarchaeota archaeon]|nr:hypothetical protein [Nanoarchaeota archaeon]
MRSLDQQQELKKGMDEIKKENPNFHVGESCIGEICPVDNCGKDATHKVGEEILYGDPSPDRHNLTSYVCCEHYQKIFGKVAELQCKVRKHDLYEKLASGVADSKP